MVSFVLAPQLLHVHLLSGSERFTFASLPSILLMVHAWGSAPLTLLSGELLYQGGPWNPPSWPLSIEFLADLVPPAFLWVFARQRQ